MTKRLILATLLALGLYAQTGTATYTAPMITPGSIAVAAGTCTAGSASSTGVCCTATGANNVVPATVVNLACQIGGVTASYQIPVASGSPYTFTQAFGANEVDMSFSVTSGVITGTGTAKVSGTVQKTVTGPF